MKTSLKFILPALLACVGTTLGTAAHALPTVELKVKGTLRPAACTPALSGEGILDYGVMALPTLNARYPTIQPIRHITLTVNCKESAKLAFSIVDNRATSRTPGIFSDAVGNLDYVFGLGAVNGVNIGGYRLAFYRGGTVDGRQAYSIVSTDKGTNWESTSNFIRHTGEYYSYSESGAMPASQKILNIPLHVQMAINGTDMLPRVEEVQLDGSATIELHYL